MDLGNRDFTKPSPDFVANSKICPFQSSADRKVPCGPDCKLYRYMPKNTGFECPFQELVPISFALRDHFNTPRKYPNSK